MSKPLRPYQAEAIDAVHKSWERHRATLLVMATGTGKTRSATEVIRGRMQHGPVLWIAHRRELIQQAKDTLEAALGVRVDVEMAQHRSAADGGLFGPPADVVVASVQTLRGGRLTKWPTHHFATIVADEAHHAVAASWRKAINHFPEAKVLGLTATPDRADRVGLGHLFEDCAYEYGIARAIDEGYLCNIRTKQIVCDDVDLTGVQVTRGDFSQKQLAAVMEVDEVLHQVAYPLSQLAADRQTAVFCSSVEHAKTLAKVIQGYGLTAEHVSGKTPDAIRAERLRAFAAKELQVLSSVNALTEGWDCPPTDCVALARPTKSRALLAQMIGRGTRLAPGKKDLLVLDFTGNTSKHTLASPLDVLYGEKELPEAQKSRALELQETTEMSAMEALEQAAKEAEERERKAELARVRAAKLKAKMEYEQESVDVLKRRSPDFWQPATKAQLRQLERKKVKLRGKRISKQKAADLLAKLADRAAKGLCTYAQAETLARHGLRTDISKMQASALLDMIAKNGWTVPPLVAEQWADGKA